MQERQTTTTIAIEAYLKRCTRDRLLIISNAVAHVRADLSCCELTDDELAQLIACHAISAGFTMISFDLKSRRYTIELPVEWSIPGWPVLGSPFRLPEAAPLAEISPRLPTDPAASS